MSTKNSSKSNCRLETKELRRGPRRYWELGRGYFLDDVFREQQPGDRCPFAGANFQLMRNFLFAAAAAGKDGQFGVLVIAPAKTSEVINGQVDAFKNDILKPILRRHVGVASYDELADLLAQSPFVASNELGKFLRRKIDSISTAFDFGPLEPSSAA